MCGICGFITKNRIGNSVFNEMVDSLQHRGPDDRGTWIGETNDNRSIGLGHRRLSIIDLSQNGHQPMSDESNRYHIVFNGEIYNFTELKSKLSEYSFKSDTDTEVLLYLYIKYGTSCIKYLNGMFAFAIYDKKENTLFAARDRMGEKPFYFYDNRGDFVFASELKAIMKYPYFEKYLDSGVLTQYFSQNTILPPKTIFLNTYKLSAGESLLWDNGNVSITSYYDPVDSYYDYSSDLILSYEKCKKELKELLYDSIEKRLISDVPIGTFLSGGIDSTLITAIAKDIRSDQGIDTFSIGFEDSRYDESVFSNEISKYLGTRHHCKIMKEPDLFRMLEKMVDYYDEPFSDSSQLPTMLVSEYAKESVTVALSGDGGDELFAGYSSNDTLRFLQRTDPVLSLVRAFFPSAMSNCLRKDKYRILFSKKIGNERIQYYAKIREEQAKKIILDNEYSGLVLDERIDNIDSWIQQRMLYDMTTYLPDEIMTKTDRASMRFSLELRSPLLDHRIVDYSMKIPLKYKYHHNEKKLILKDLLYEFVPKDLIDRPKRGFRAPVYKWLTNDLREQLEQFLEPDYIEKQSLFDKTELKNLYMLFVQREETSVTQLMWSYFVFQIWYNKFLVN